MDRHLFRGKQLNNGEWTIGFLVGDDLIRPSNLGSGFTTEDMATGMFKCPAVSIISSTLGQCTGERYNKDTLFFEGDIVEILANGELKDKGVICFYRSAFQVKIGDSYTNMNAPCIMITRIIGNIHDNPELLK